MNGNTRDNRETLPLETLPLVPFEEYMLIDDRAAYPMNFFFRLNFSGRFDRDKLNAALQEVVPRHPLLCARVREDKRKRLQWASIEGDEPAVQWVAPTETTADVNGYPHCPGIDLRRRSGLKVRGLPGEQSDDLLLQFHHSCCDGVGAFQLIEELLVAYALACGNAPPRASLQPLDEQLLRRRGDFHLTPLKFLRMLPAQASGLLGALQFLMHRPQPIIPHEPPRADAPPSEAYPSALTSCLNEAESAEFRSTAERFGVSKNDLLLKDLFRSLENWRSQDGFSTEGEWLRLSVPMNLRAESDHRMPAANVVSMVFLDRKGEDIVDGGRFLSGIHEEMQLIKRRRLGLTFIFSLKAFRFLPGGLRRYVQTDRCTATSVITNLGSPLQEIPLNRDEGRIVVGNTVLEGMELLAPLRPYTIAAFAAFTYAKKLCVTLHYDPRYLDNRQAADLLETYMGCLRESIGH